jgi:hypothetical protein
MAKSGESNLKILATIVMALALIPSPVGARDACNEDGYREDRHGDRYPTPTCQARLIGSVARSHGIRVSDKHILNQPGSKQEVCDTVGYDPRLEIACAHRTGWYGQKH